MIKDIKYKNPGSSSTTRNEKIHNIIFDKRKDAEYLVAQEIINLVKENNKKNKKTVLGLATGFSPIGVYKSLIQLHKEEKVSFKNVVTFNLDEYYGMNKNHKESYHSFMEEKLFKVINVKRENIHIPNGELEKKNIDGFCTDY